MSDEAPKPPDAKPGGIPWATVLKIAAAVLPILAGQTVVSDWRADSKKNDAVKESKENTRAEVEKVKPVAFASADEVKQMKTEMARMAYEIQKLNERGRKKAGAPADTGKAKDESHAALHAIKVRNEKPNPALVPAPDTAPPAPQIPTPKLPDDARKQ